MSLKENLRQSLKDGNPKLYLQLEKNGKLEPFLNERVDQAKNRLGKLVEEDGRDYLEARELAFADLYQIPTSEEETRKTTPETPQPATTS
jgi:hypothetical protein